MKNTLLGIAAIAALIGTPALAADMPVKAPPLPPAPASAGPAVTSGATLAEGGITFPLKESHKSRNPVTPQDFGSDSGSAFVGGGQSRVRLSN